MSADDGDPVALIAALADARIDFVVVGGQAAIAHGSAYPSEDVDIAYSRDEANIERIVAFLAAIGGARLRRAPEGLPFVLDERTLRESRNLTLSTSLGDLDLLGEPLGAPGFEELRGRATLIDLDGRRVPIAGLADLIAMKEAAGRPKDMRTVDELRILSSLVEAPDDRPAG